MALASLFLLVLPKWSNCPDPYTTIHLHLKLRAEGPRRHAKIYLKYKNFKGPLSSSVKMASASLLRPSFLMNHPFIVLGIHYIVHFSCVWRKQYRIASEVVHKNHALFVGDGFSLFVV